jgi:hypothetical protein
MMTRWFYAIGLAGLVGLCGCSAEPSGPVAATLNLDFITPSEDVGAVLFTISGGPIDSVTASDYRLYSTRIDASTTRVILVGNVSSGRLARIYLSDERRIPDYSTTINQVAARGTYLQRDPAAHGMALVR